MPPVGGRRAAALLLVVLLVTGPVGGAAVETPFAGLAGSSGDIGTATADGGQTETLGPPDWPSAPLAPEDVPGRWVVENTSEHPASAVGHLGASGVVVSEYHVLTAAHVVTDDQGNVEDVDEIVFTPGLRAPPDGSAAVPYGRAGVTEVHVHPEWDGDPPEQDLALLTLDRPVGVHTGTMALDPVAVESVEDHDLRQAGYVDNVTGYRQIASSPRLQAGRTRTNPGYLHYCAPLSNGDSGSPVWTEVDGAPTVLAINTDWDVPRVCEDAAVGVAMDRDRVRRVAAWTQRDPRPPAKADLAVASEHAGPFWVEAADALPEEPVDANASGVTVGTRVYNNGPLSVGDGPAPRTERRATVSFTATVRRPVDGETVTVAAGRSLCEAEVAVGAYANATATCEVDELPDDVRPGDELVVRAHVDPADAVPEYASSPVDGTDGPQPVGVVAVEDAAA